MKDGQLGSAEYRGFCSAAAVDQELLITPRWARAAWWDWGSKLACGGESWGWPVRSWCCTGCRTNGCHVGRGLRNVPGGGEAARRRADEKWLTAVG